MNNSKNKSKQTGEVSPMSLSQQAIFLYTSSQAVTVIASMILGMKRASRGISLIPITNSCTETVTATVLKGPNIKYSGHIDQVHFNYPNSFNKMLQIQMWDEFFFSFILIF